MSTVKGFIVIPSLQKNTPGENSQFGELSQMSCTFSREQGIYEASSDTLLHSFYSVDSTDNKIIVPTTVVTAIGAVAQIIFDLYTDDQMGSIDDTDELLTTVNTLLTPGTVSDLLFTDKIESVEVGMTNYWMPGSADFVVVSGGENVNVRIWFTNNEFETQYDEYEIVVLPPVINDIDDLNATPSTINNIINTAGNMANMLPRISLAIDGKPPTVITNLPLTWHDPSGTSSTYTTGWAVLCWGPGGASPSNIRPVILDFIIENSALDQTVWQIIYPELYEAMEFYVIPFWDNIAIPELGPVSGIYSPVLNDYSLINLRGTTFSYGLTAPQVSTTSALIPLLYKSLVAVVVGNPSNTDGVVYINSLYSDYCLIPTSHADFDRMDPETKDFVIKLNQGLSIAEEATNTSTVPAGFAREVRGGFIYITFSIGGVDFLIATKATVLGGI